MFVSPIVERRVSAADTLILSALTVLTETYTEMAAKYWFMLNPSNTLKRCHCGLMFLTLYKYSITKF